jgi:hypothetical protein
MLKDERESKLCLGHSARLCHKLNMMDEEARSSQSLFVVGLLGPQGREKKGRNNNNNMTNATILHSTFQGI